MVISAFNLRVGRLKRFVMQVDEHALSGIERMSQLGRISWDAIAYS
jgi:hypothetical protein